MIYYLLPNININIYNNLDCIFSEDIPKIFISNSLSYYLYEIKNKIKIYEKEWNVYKKYTNPYEFINTIIPGKNKCISKYKPLSRSYFKMIEIIHFLIYGGDFTLYNNFSEGSHNKNSICTFHLAEGPGGFIEAIVNTRNNPNDKYYGMTIIDDNENNKLYSLPDNRDKSANVPGWRKSEHFLKSNPNVMLENGADGTGNILSMDNFLYCRAKYGNTMDLITGDGGFDFSVDFNNQEITMSQLLFAQVCYAIILQKNGGNFILKIFDCFMEHTVDILYILSSLYEKVYITKPQTSRYANSEKYLICKNYLPMNDSAIFPYFKNVLKKIIENNEKKYIQRFLKIPISNFYLYKLEEYNSIFGQQQIENIYQTIMLIENKYKEEKEKESDKDNYYNRNNINAKTTNLINTNIKKCIQWCIKYNVNYNNYFE